MNRQLTLTLVSLIVATMLAVIACKKEAPSAPKSTNEPGKVMILVDSGLGGPQLHELVTMLRQEFPQANVVDFQTGRDAYLADVPRYVRENPHAPGVVYIGHSFGVSNGFNVLDQLGDVRLFIDIDGVRNVFGGHKKFIVGPNVRRCVVITGDFSGLIRESVHGPFEEYKVPNSGHNAMTKRPELMNLVKWTVREAIQ